MRLTYVALSIALLVGCGKKSEEPPDEGGGAPTAQGTGAAAGTGAAGTSAAATGGKAAFEARKIFNTVCAACHGPGGKGDGSAAVSLNPKPRNYTDPAWQASVTDDDIKNIILKGGQAMGKSATMPAQPQLAEQPEVLDEIVKLIRGFAPKT